MHQEPVSRESAALHTIRLLLIALVFIGILGTVVDLLLLGHIESWAERSPLVLLAATFVVATWYVAAPTAATVRALQLAMLLCVATGLIGIGYHYASNEEFERELYPTVGGMTLLRESLSGATPLLAPGSLVMLGLVGLTATIRHPRLAGSTPGTKE
jgi:hypothetical protein